MKNNLTSTGLSPATIDKIQQLFRRYPLIERVCLYGSRAKGNYQPGSDIDLTIMGEGLPPSQLPGLENELDDLLLPYKIDLCLFRQIENDDLVDHIRRVGVDFYRREE
jgi:predicted nucleotidyltransferase